jgi:hypothetical protein
MPFGIGYDSLTDEEWRARDDARTLAEAELIKADAGRMNKTQEAAIKMADENKEEKEAMENVAAGKHMFPNSPEMFEQE